ncbi:MAG TPA: glycosyltransferase [Solirubrobacteraceae bacterium]|jgi:GT2 family glycosyltransferase/glycosyltransferase involved in cell wall biosynthesis|nr:glycosyltransferase [Solirubrobacteraceae bacterium]
MSKQQDQDPKPPIAARQEIAAHALDGEFSGPLAGLRRRIYLTYRYLGWRTLLFRVLSFPLRFTPLRHRLRLRSSSSEDAYRRAVAWYRDHGEPVDIVIPSYRDAELVASLVRSIQATVPEGLARIIVADDASGAEHVAALHAIAGIEVVEGAENSGFAANVNRGLRASSPERDVVVLNSDIEARPGWLACLQYAASQEDDIGIVGARLLYPDGRIQFAGTVRNLGAPEWFDHRYRFKPADWGPAGLASPALAVTGACMYVTRATIEQVGLLDERYPMAYEDVDWCLRAWQAGFRVLYFPAASLYHHESVTRGKQVGEREAESQRVFWERWGDFFDAREVRTPEGKLRIAYVTEGTGIGGGHRDIFEHLNRLLERGHEVSLYTLGEQPDWFDLRAPVHSFEYYDDLVAALAPLEAIKVATWWNTAAPVWQASVLRGVAAYFVQDIETSYYPDDERTRHAVIDSYRPEFRYMTISAWNRERLRELGLDAELIPPGIDLENFRPLANVARREEMVLAIGRTNPLKNLPLTLDAWRALADRPELCLFGIEPELAADPGMRHVQAPSDERVNELFNEATVFIQTSTHEGFALPPLEAMAAGCAVVCTDAHGNRDFCVDGENCLMPVAGVEQVSAALARLLTDPELRQRLGRAGIETAKPYAWERRIDALEQFFEGLAQPRSGQLAAKADA